MTLWSVIKLKNAKVDNAGVAMAWWLWHLTVDWEAGVQSPVGANLWPQVLSLNNHLIWWLPQSGLRVVQIAHMNKKPDLIIKNTK